MAQEDLFERLKGHLIAQGLKPGDKVEAETSLAERFGVSRHHIRQVLAVMVQAGILDRSLLAQLLLLQQCLLGSLELLREINALTFQLLDTAFCLLNLVLVIKSFPCQLLALVRHLGLRFLPELIRQLAHQGGCPNFCVTGS